MPGFLRGDRVVAIAGSPDYFILYEVDELATPASKRRGSRRSSPESSPRLRALALEAAVAQREGRLPGRLGLIQELAQRGRDHRLQAQLALEGDLLRLLQQGTVELALAFIGVSNAPAHLSGSREGGQSGVVAATVL